MKSKHPINSRVFVVALALVPIVQATPRLHGGPTHPPANEAPRFDGGPDHAAAVITVRSTGDVTRGKVSRATVSAGVTRVAMHEVFRVYRTAHSPSPTAGNTSLRSFGSVGFQTCRIAYSLKSAGREAAPAVGLEICAARRRAGDLTHNLSLSFVNSCQR